jgi:hypothetical protein
VILIKPNFFYLLFYIYVVFIFRSAERLTNNVGIGHLYFRHKGQSELNLFVLSSLNLSFIQVLISRNYRGDIEMNVIEKFMQLLLEKEDDSQLSPIFEHDNIAFVYIKYNNVYRTYFLSRYLFSFFEFL